MTSYLKEKDFFVWRATIFFIVLHLIFICFIFYALIWPIYAFFADRSEKILEQRNILSRYEAVAGQAAQVEAYSRNVSDSNVNGELIVGASEGITAASLQDTLKSLAERAHTTVISIQMLPKKNFGAVSLIGARIEINGSFENTYKLYKIVEEVSPTLIINRAYITSLTSMPQQSQASHFPMPNMPNKAAPRQSINAQLDIYAGAITRGAQ